MLWQSLLFVLRFLPLNSKIQAEVVIQLAFATGLFTKSNLSLQSSVVESADSAYILSIRFSAYAKAEENKTREIAVRSSRCISQLAEL
jgi:hypothetical protein